MFKRFMHYKSSLISIFMIIAIVLCLSLAAVAGTGGHYMKCSHLAGCPGSGSCHATRWFTDICAITCVEYFSIWCAFTVPE